MQSVSAGFNKVIAENHMVEASSRLIAEWNHNRFASRVTARNNKPGSGKHPESFPIDSIARPNRPDTGICYGVVGQATVARISADDPRFKLASEKEELSYSYWISPKPSRTNRTLPDAEPQVTYSRAYPTNKIIAKFEMANARTSTGSSTSHFRNRPTLVDIMITRDGVAWNTIGTNIQPNERGRIALYLQANGSWNSNVNFANTINVRGVRAVIKEMQSEGLYANVIEVSARLVKDLSDDVVSIKVNKSREEQSAILPVGTMEANQCSIELANADTNRYDPHFTGSDIYGLVDANAKFTVFMGVRVGAFYEYTPQGVYYADSWTYDTNSATVQVQATDYSKFLQQTLMPSTFFDGYNITSIFREVLERAGVVDVVIDRSPKDKNYTIPYVWFNEEQTVWDAMVEVVGCDMGAFYFDEYGRLKVQSRDRIYMNTQINYAFSEIPIGNTLPNIISLSNEFTVEANKAVVRYSPLKPNVDEIGDPIETILWRAEDTIVVHGSPLQTSMTGTSNVISLSAREAETWPYESEVNIEGEIMRYKGKRVNKKGTFQYALKTSDEEYKLSDGWVTTGDLMNAARGLKGTQAVPHSTAVTWGIHRTGPNGNAIATNASMKTIADGRLSLALPSNVSRDDWLQSARGASPDSYGLYGTAVIFSKENVKHGMAGLSFHRQSTTNGAGYYIELVLSAYSLNQMNGTIGNIRCYRMESNGQRTGLPPSDEGKRGFDLPIIPGRLYYIELSHSTNYDPVAKVTNHNYAVFVNGQIITSFTDNKFTKGLWGMFVRGNTKADFEYFYTWTPRAGTEISIEEDRFLDRIKGDYISGYSARLRTAPSGSNWFFDEFGPIVHESKEFEVDYSIIPALNSRIINFNDWQALAYNHVHTPFKSTFIVDNTSRMLAVVHGEDTWTYPGETFNPTILISGQAVVKDEEKSEEVENELAIRKRGPVEVEVNNPWIQNEEHAKAIGKFIVDRWGEPVDIVKIDAFIHPALQTGDLVTINIPRRHMAPAGYKYYVIAIDLSYDGSLSGSVMLRRAR